jgi:hypothetical protein
VLDNRNTGGKHAGHEIYRLNAGISLDLHRLDLCASGRQNLRNCTGQLGLDLFAAAATDEQPFRSLQNAKISEPPR